MHTITLLEPIHEHGARLLESRARVHRLTGPADPGLGAALADSDAIVVRSTPVGAEILDLGPKLRVIGRHGAGTDNIDKDLASSRGITVVNTPRSNTESVAEYTIAALMHLFKRFDAVQSALRDGAFDPARGSLPGQVDRLGLIGRELSGAHLGIVGAGAIGRSVAGRALALGMRVSAVDPFADRAALAETGIALVDSLEELLPALDAISIHVPGGLSDEPVIGAAELALLPESAVLVNAARGDVVDEQALALALDEGRLAGAAVDVFSSEPPRPDHPLLRARNVLVTPHMAAMTAESLERMAVDVAQGTLAALDAGPKEEA